MRYVRNCVTRIDTDQAVKLCELWRDRGVGYAIEPTYEQIAKDVLTIVVEGSTTTQARYMHLKAYVGSAESPIDIEQSRS